MSLTPEQIQQYRQKYNVGGASQSQGQKPVGSSLLDSLRQNGGQPKPQSLPAALKKPEKNIAQKAADATVLDFAQSAVINPALRFGQALGSGGLKIADKVLGGRVDQRVQRLTGNTLDQQLEKATAGPTNVPIMGSGGGVDVAPTNTFEDAFKQTAGDALKTASWTVGTGGASKVATSTLKGKIGQGLLEGLKYGAAGGALFGAGEGIQQEDATMGSVAKDTAVGGLIGGVAGGTLGGALPTVPAAVRGFKPEEIMQRVARISKGKQAKFEATAGESVGEYLTKRGIYGEVDDVANQLYQRFTLSKTTADEALATLPGNYKEEIVNTALEELAEREVRVSAPGAISPDSGRVNQLLNKHNQEGLSMSEINEVKRLYERNVKLDYIRDNVSDKITRSNNIDNRLRQWQFDTAENLGLQNLPQINRETRLARQLMDDLGKEYAGSAGNNAMTLTDWIMLSGGDPTAVGGFIVKKTLSSKSVMSKIAKTLAGKPTVGLPTAEKVGQLSLPAPKPGQPNVEMRSGGVTPVLPAGRNIDMPGANPAGKSTPSASPTQNSPSTKLNDVRMYESYDPNLPKISLGAALKSKSNLPVADGPPKVFSNAKVQEKYVPTNELPVIDFGKNIKKKDNLPVVKDAPKVYENRKAQTATTIINNTKNNIEPIVPSSKNNARKLSDVVKKTTAQKIQEEGLLKPSSRGIKRTEDLKGFNNGIDGTYALKNKPDISELKKGDTLIEFSVPKKEYKNIVVDDDYYEIIQDNGDDIADYIGQRAIDSGSFAYKGDVPPSSISKITDSNGKVVFEQSPMPGEETFYHVNWNKSVTKKPTKPLGDVVKGETITDPMSEFNNKSLKVFDSDEFVGKASYIEALDDIGGVDNVKRTTVSIDDLTPTETSLDGERKARALAEIKDGLRIPLVVDDFGNGLEITDGNHRYSAYKRLGIKEIPVVLSKDIKTKPLGDVVKGKQKEVEPIQNILNKEIAKHDNADDFINNWLRKSTDVSDLPNEAKRLEIIEYLEKNDKRGWISSATDAFNKAKPKTKPFADVVKKKPNTQGGYVALGGNSNVTTKILQDLKGRTTVSKQYILDATNRGELRQAERDLIRSIVDDFNRTVNVEEFTNKVQAQLIPLKATGPGGVGSSKKGQYENIALPDDVRGDVAEYKERVYTSPIKNSASDVHFQGDIPDYFAHSRIEDMADGKTRRVIEAQSDLFQKGGLESEMAPSNLVSFKMTDSEIRSKLKNAGYSKKEIEVEVKKVAKYKTTEAARIEEMRKLEPYRNTWHERIIREEVAQAAKYGKTKLQFPTGETAMKVEGLGDSGIESWGRMLDLDTGKTITFDDFKKGTKISSGNRGDWVVTDVLEDGKFKAVPKRVFEEQARDSWNIVRERGTNGETIFVATNRKTGATKTAKTSKEAREFIETRTSDSEKFARDAEQFDISGKIDANNPIYKFYEKDVQKFLKKNYDAKMVTDDKGVTWIQLDVNPSLAKEPVQAFGTVGTSPLFTIAGTTGAVSLGAALMKKKPEPKPAPAPEPVQPVEKPEPKKPTDDNIRNGFIQSENRGARDRGENLYESIGEETSDLGKYQVHPETLEEWGELWLDKAYTPEEFLKDPEAQEEFMNQFIAVAKRYKLTPEDTAIVWHKGWGALGDQKPFEEKNRLLKEHIARQKKNEDVLKYVEHFMDGFGS